MNRLKSVLVATLIAGLLLPSAAAAQEANGLFNGMPGRRLEPLPDVRLAFTGERSANIWRVFSGDATAAGAPGPGRRTRVAPEGSFVGHKTVVAWETAGQLKNRRAASRGAGQSSLCCGNDIKPVVVVILTLVCIVLAAAYGVRSGR